MANLLGVKGEQGELEIDGMTNARPLCCREFVGCDPDKLSVLGVI